MAPPRAAALAALTLAASLGAASAAHGPSRLVARLSTAPADGDAPDEEILPGHRCVHDELHRRHPRIRHLTATGAQDHGSNAGRRLQAATYAPLRISVQFTGFDDNPAFATQAAFVRQTLMPRATARMAAMLSITPVVGPLFAHRDCARYDTSASPARCVSYSTATDCANFDGEYPILFTADQLGADPVWSTSSRSWSNLPGGGGFPNADLVVFATLLQTDICGTTATGGTVSGG